MTCPVVALPDYAVHVTILDGTLHLYPSRPDGTYDPRDTPWQAESTAEGADEFLGAATAALRAAGYLGPVVVVEGL